MKKLEKYGKNGKCRKIWKKMGKSLKTLENSGKIRKIYKNLEKSEKSEKKRKNLEKVGKIEKKNFSSLKYFVYKNFPTEAIQISRISKKPLSSSIVGDQRDQCDHQKVELYTK